MKQYCRLAFVLALASLAWAPIARADVTVWGVRGKVWKELDEFQRHWYLQGLLDTLFFSDWKIEGQKIMLKTSLEHLQEATDQFYADYRNELIPVPFALKVISMELEGRAKSDVDVELEALRKKFVDLRKK